MLLWGFMYPIRLGMRYMARSCRKYARADEGTVRHLATLHALQAFIFGTVLGLLCAYLLFVDGMQYSSEVSSSWPPLRILAAAVSVVRFRGLRKMASPSPVLLCCVVYNRRLATMSKSWRC